MVSQVNKKNAVNFLLSTTVKSLASVAVLSTLSAGIAEAALLGDTIEIGVADTGQPSGTTQINVVIDPGVEFSFDFGSGDTIEVDVKNSSFDIIYTDIDSPTGFGSFDWFLSDLNWVDNLNGIITGVTQTGGIAVDNLSFTDDSIFVTVPSISEQVGVTTFSFDIETDHQTTPEPVSILGLFAFGAMGAASMLKRK